jgi:hypothetical protein
MVHQSFHTGDEGPSNMVLSAVDEFVQQLRRRQVAGSTATARRTAMILRVLVASSRRSNAQDLLKDVLKIGMQMQAAKPLGAHPHMHLYKDLHVLDVTAAGNIPAY